MRSYLFIEKLSLEVLSLSDQQGQFLCLDNLILYQAFMLQDVFDIPLRCFSFPDLLFFRI